MARRRVAVSPKFASALQLVRWAEDDIREVKGLTRLFFASDVHKRVSKVDADGINYLDVIRLTNPLPPRIAKQTISAINNLRSALDHAACAVVPTTARKGTYFPFGDTKRKFEGQVKSKAKHVPDEIKSLFRALKPYKRGNPPLWALNKIANTHKHRTIVEPAVHVKDVEFVGHAPGSGLNALLRHSRPRWNRRKNEIIISRVAGDTTVHHDVDLSLGVAFGKVPVFAGIPVLSVLRYLADKVESILWTMETEARRIGIVR